MRRGLIVAALHVGIVCSLGVKLLVDRSLRPRVWARVAPIDPDLPIRGRYVRLEIEVEPADGVPVSPDHSWNAVSLDVREGRLIARRSDETTGLYAQSVQRGRERVVVLTQAIPYFIPEHVPDPSRREPGEELWVEVTIPRRGGPRPIRLGVKKDGHLIPLPLD